MGSCDTLFDVDAPIELQTTVYMVQRWHRRARRFWYLLCAASALTSAVGDVPFGYMLVVALLYGLFESKVAHALSKKRAHLRVDEAGLSVDGELVIARGETNGGYLRPAHEKHEHSARLRFGARDVSANARHTVECDVPDDVTGNAILHAMGIAPAQSTMTFMVTAMPTWLIALAPVFTLLPWLLSLAALGPRYAVSSFVALFLLSVVLPWTLSSRRVVIGGDGLFVQGLGSKRFVSYGSIAAVTAGSNVGVVECDDHTKMRLFTESGFSRRSETMRDALLARIEEARSAYSAPDAATADPLARAEQQDHDAWIASLRAISREGSSYRANDVPTDALYAVLDDPAQSAAKRAAAAFVLRLRVPEEAAPRIRVLAEAAAEPEFRSTLMALAGDDVEEAAASLGRIRATAPRMGGAP